MGKIISKRRIFIKKNKDFAQLFSFNQEQDGSIYCGMPEFTNIKWMNLVKYQNATGMIISDSTITDGKLSIHGSGMTTFRSHAEPKGHKLIVKGNYLLDLEHGKAGVRHLFSAFFQEPYFLPLSPARNRETDYLLESSTGLNPFVMLFFAVPSKPLTIEVNASFQADDLESIPPETGWGAFELRNHHIVWFYYRTKHMDKWPKNTHICYHDGFLVPFFIGIGPGSCRIEMRQPIFIKTDRSLIISLPTFS